MFLRPKKRVKNKSNFQTLFFLFILLNGVCAGGQSELEKQLFEFLNSERNREKLMPLSWDEELHSVAVRHSEDMSRTGRTSHKGSDGKEPHDRVRLARIYSSKTGENIARDINVISAHTLLMQSLDHRENILDPGFSHAAVGIVERNRHLYITELFIHKIYDYSLNQARDTLVRQYNFYRQDKRLTPLSLSDSLNRAAQAHAEVQTKLDALSPMLAMSSIGKASKGPTIVSIYTATSLMEIPQQVGKDLESNTTRIGIGFKRTEGEICTGGCYLIVLVLG
jgi:uncharacterized protein YkwD